ncbi:MAG: maleylpyruvate isomerase family mycothiol-dependent enzyme [Dermatophilaceae bacterium]|jgi:maleylpyruvate isomerase|nr:maleylpyruvate isomerase family mycothiol-dependent enzyme [Candidatus Phosphoribacter baldrii]MBP9918820.1 maleylpyruvate isomerase family mycothiol-dependent enzyme [Dermatophilaceae bacterium]
MTTGATWSDVADATRALWDTAYRLREGDQHAPSLCDGWTRGHVFTHVARNADAIGNLVTWAVTGVPTPMYASPEAREHDIQAGSTRALADLVADMENSATSLAGVADRLGPEHAAREVELRGGWTVTASQLPWLRLREVCYHHVDLLGGVGWADLPDRWVAAFLTDEVDRLSRRSHPPALTLRSDEGDTHTVGDGTAYVTGSRAALLGWLARGLADGVSCDGPLPTLPKGV